MIRIRRRASAGVDVDRAHQRILDAVGVVRVAQERLPQLGRGAGELAEHQRAAVVDPGGDVLLGDQVHAVAQRGHHHHVGRAVERGQLGAAVRLVQVVHGRHADPAEVAVDPADLALDLVRSSLVVLDPLPARRRDLDHHRRPALSAGPSASSSRKALSRSSMPLV